jgi:hypothetical protein
VVAPSWCHLVSLLTKTFEWNMTIELRDSTGPRAQRQPRARTVTAPSAPSVPLRPAFPRADMGQRRRRARALAWRCLLVQRFPQVETFELLRPTARWRETLGLLSVTGAVTGLLYKLHGPLGLGVPRVLLEGALLGVPVLLALFFLMAGVLAGCMRLLGGWGSFREYAELLALGGMPLVALAAAGNLVPVVGGILNAALALYGALLAALAAAAVYRLSLWRAVLGVLLALSALAVLFVAAAVGVVLLALKAGTLG